MTHYHLTPKSKNAKTGPIPVTTTAASTCPKTCPFNHANQGGCYAEAGPLKLHWRAVTEGKRGGTLDALCDAVEAFPDGQLWRHNQAGDLPGDGETIDGPALAQLTDANRGKRGFTYTHYAPTGDNLAEIRAANDSGFTVNLSGNSPAHADTLADTGLPTVTVLPMDAPNVSTTPKGRKVIACPAEKSERVSCATCGLCQVRDRDYLIGFRAHGTSKKKADAIARA